MAIQTQGFQVRNMPQYTAPNPSLVAFSPQPVLSGLGDAFRLAQQLEQLKASKALQAELAATREGRIAAQQAKDLSSIRLLPAKTQADLDILAADAPNIPRRGELAGLGITRDLGALRGEIGRQPVELQTKDLISGMALRTAQSQEEQLQDVLNTQGYQNYVNLADAMAAAGNVPQVAEDRAKVQAGTLADQVANLDQDLLTRRALAEAKLDTQRAQAQHLREVSQGGVLPKGTTYERAIEQVAGKLHMTPDQVRQFAGNRVGLSILSKIDAASKSQFGTQPRFTPEEEAFLAVVVGPKPGPARPVSAPSTAPAPKANQQKAAPTGNKIKFRTDAAGNIVPVTN